MKADVWQPVIIDAATPSGREQLETLRASGGVREVYDTLTDQRRDWARVRTPARKLTDDEADARVKELLGKLEQEFDGRWVFYPWSGRLVSVLPPRDFECVRTNRNRNKLTADEQATLSGMTAGIVGLSVGNAIARTLMLEGVVGGVKLADFDTLDLSNLNRLQAGIHQLGLNKAVLAARQIFEFDPYARVSVYPDGIHDGNVDAFLTNDPPVDIVVDECDSLDVKFLLRERARTHRLPVIMETSDRGLLDVERFDLEPERPIFHGRVPGLDRRRLAELSAAEKVAPILDIVGLTTVSARMGASLVEVGRTLSTWPQLGSDVALGGATVTAAVRRIGLGQRLDSGRVHIDIEEWLDRIGTRPPPGSEARRELKDVPIPSLPAEIKEKSLVASSGNGAAPLTRTLELHRFVIEHAVRAPSGGNCQPWRFETMGPVLCLLLDRTRATNLLDVGYRASALALGAAIENATIAAARHGFDTDIEVLPEGDSSERVARLRFVPDTSLRIRERASWLEAVVERVTNRRNEPAHGLTRAEMDTLTAAASSADGAFEAIVDPPTLTTLGRALGEADRVRFLCPGLHRDMIGEVRWSKADVEQTRDGLDLATLELTPSDHAALRLLARPEVVAILRTQNGGTALTDAAVNSVRNAAGLGLVRVRGDGFRDFLTAGRAVQRVWLSATRQRLALHPMSALTFMARLAELPEGTEFTQAEKASIRAQFERVQDAFTSHRDWTPAFLFRLTRASTVTARSLRRPVEEVWSIKPAASA